MLDIAQAIKVVSDAGIIGLLLIFLVGGLRQWWVFGWYFQAMERDRDQWRDLALKGTELAHRAITATAIAPPGEE